MRLLLDTHFVVELLDDDSRSLRRGAAWRAVRSPESVPLASVASLWEIAIKSRLGKLPLHAALSSVPAALRILGVELLAIEADHVLADLDPKPATRDPFDRLLLAQCQVEGPRLVTLDRELAGHPLAWREA